MYLLCTARCGCLQSLTSGGIRAARYDAFRRMIAQTYGYQHLYTLSNLEKAGGDYCYACAVCLLSCCNGRNLGFCGFGGLYTCASSTKI
jgi:hypothetical protein